jgi:mannonate dehydratase
MNRRGLLSLVAGAAFTSRAAPSFAEPRRAAARLKVGCQKGPTNDSWLRFFARHGVRNICGSFAARPPGPYTVAELTSMRDRCAEQGISLDMVRLPFLRPSNVDDDRRAAIVLGESPARDRDIDEIATTLRNCARAGIVAVTYNLSLLGYQRNRTSEGRGGALYRGWRLADESARATQPTRAGRVPAEVYWERITYFLDRIVPVANECRVRIACHPHDPPTPPGFRGVDAVLGTVDGLKKFVAIRESPYHGLNFCQGTIAEMLTDPARELPSVIRYFGRRKKIFNVHFRNIEGRLDDFLERQPDEGDLDMFALLRIYAELGYDGMLMPDHVPKHPDDPDERQALAFAYGYIRGLIARLG